MTMSPQTYDHRFRLFALWESPMSQPSHRLVLGCRPACAAATGPRYYGTACTKATSSGRRICLP
jgi:hypothetical protein